ncbi:unnamed protein product [Brassica oleracea]|uniref:(rape) hypothetical protein n=1 Tax=Brassica napus TaxID=3708 RepID=A0A816K470_BRANA|nr:unnamed protein product [Brassica napus]
MEAKIETLSFTLENQPEFQRVITFILNEHLWWLTLNLIWVSPCVYVGGHTSPHCGRSASERSGADCYSRGSGE